MDRFARHCVSSDLKFFVIFDEIMNTYNTLARNNEDLQAILKDC